VSPVAHTLKQPSGEPVQGVLGSGRGDEFEDSEQ